MWQEIFEDGVKVGVTPFHRKYCKACFYLVKKQPSCKKSVVLKKANVKNIQNQGRWPRNGYIGRLMLKSLVVNVMQIRWKCFVHHHINFLFITFVSFLLPHWCF